MRAAAVQLNATDDTDRNLETADRLVREAARNGADVVVLPEKWPAFGTGDVLVAAAQPMDGPAMRWASSVASELGIDLVAGSFVERVPEAERFSNTSIHFGPDGSQRALYRKIHMFDVEVDGTVYAESEHEQGGREIVVTTVAGDVGLGMSVCYDLRFPELYRVLAVRGALVVVVPAAFTLATTRDHWEVLLRARAIENQCFVVAANQIGEHSGGYRSGGRSMIVDPWGLVLARAADTEGIIVADLDLEALAEVRRRLPALAGRRPDVYGWDG